MREKNLSPKKLLAQSKKLLANSKQLLANPKKLNKMFVYLRVSSNANTCPH